MTGAPEVAAPRVMAVAARLWRRPAVTIALSAYAIAGLCVLALLIALHMPAFGARFDQAGKNIGVAFADGRTLTVRPETDVTVTSSAGRLHAAAGSLVPDYMPDGGPGAVRDWYRWRDALIRVAGTHGATIAVAGDAGVVRAPLALRPRVVGDLPIDFWLLLTQAIVIGLLGIGVRLARPRDLRAWLFGASSDGVFLAGFSGAIFDARELAADGTLLQAMQGLNFIGSNLCAVGLCALFLHVPHAIAGRRATLALLVAAVVLGVLEGLAVIPRTGFYVGLLLPTLAFPAIFIAQWRRTRHDPAGRAVLRWNGAWTFFGSSQMGLAMAAPILFGVAPIASDGMIIVPLLLIYGGIAFGVAGFRVFELDRWAYRLVLGALAILLLVLGDAALVTVVRLEQPVALALSVLAIGYLYFPLRALLWRWISGAHELSSDALFREAAIVAFSGSAQARRAGWRALLDRVFEPLEIAPGEEATGTPAIREKGEALVLPAIADDTALSLRFARRGRRLFGLAELSTARELITLMKEAERTRAEYGRGVAEERSRIARDLHDDVSAHLLTGLHRSDVAQVRGDVRQALTEIRTIVSSMAGPALPLETALADLRFETAERLLAAGIGLDWPIDGMAMQPVVLDYTHHKALASSVREAVSNVIKHAGATTLKVTVAAGEAVLTVTLADDGTGPKTRHPVSGNGLGNIAQRLGEIGGTCTASAGPVGFAVVLRMPLTALG
jgi:signal transduction histidine kinase